MLRAALPAVFFVLAGGGAGMAATDQKAALAEIDRRFVCPEALPDKAAKMAALSDFMKSAASAAPDMTLAQLIEYRMKLLGAHHCTQTLLNIAQAGQRAVESGDIEGQSWLPIAQWPGLQVFASTDYLKPFLDPRRPDEPAVDTYDKLAFQEPHETNVTHVTYDEVISHNIFYCRTAAFALVENDYFLKRKLVLKDASPVEKTLGVTKVYEIEPIHAQTPGEAAARWACGAGAGAVAANAPGPPAPAGG